MGKYKRDKGLQIPMEQRQNLNAKILYLVENHETELYGITPEDIFNVYMGNGGLHGLDRKDFQNFHAYTEAKKEIEQGQFFTPAEICEFLVACVKPEPKDIIYDLTYGKGDFFNYLPTESNIYGTEIDMKAVKIAQYLYPKANLQYGDIRQYSPVLSGDIVFGNPPFHLEWGTKEAPVSSQMYYCKKAYQVLKNGGLLVLLVSESFLSDDFSNKGDIEEINHMFNLIVQFSLPADAFKEYGVTSFRTKAMILQKKSQYVTERPYTTELEVLKRPQEIYELFSYSYLPKKITVFGLEKANQDIYNASFLDELLEKTVITKNFEEVVGRKIYKIYQGTCSFSEREKEVYRIAVKEFDKIRRKYFAACGNARKDSMFRILQQLLLLLKICADPSLAYEYDSNEIPTKVKKAIRLLQMWKYEKVAIGVRRIEVADSYYRYLKQAFPERQIFYITGDKVPCKQRQRIVEKLRKTENGILLSTQQSLSESMNIDDVDKIILPELHYNHAAMEQYYFRFIRYTSRNFKQVVFLIYENSIEVNLLKMILAKEKLNLFMKNQLLENGELYERFGINPQIFSLLMTTSVDQEGKLQIQWGEQKIS